MTYIKPADAGKMLGISVNTVRDWCQQGRIPYYKPNGHNIVLTKEEVEEYISQTRVPTQDELNRKANKMIGDINARLTDRSNHV